MNRDLFHSGKPWESPERCGEGRLPMRSPLMPFASAAAALDAVVAGPQGALPGAGEAANRWKLGLDGAWRFALTANPEAVPRGVGGAPGFADPAFDDAGWADLRVPGSWTLQGYDKPHYTNVIMPFGNVPPSAPAEHNPTGLYRVRFQLPAGWEGRRVVLHVGGAESFLEAWCNGSRLGFSKDTRLPSEFDLTPFITGGGNLLAFMVIRYSDASYVEDQDQWWYGGIYRSVYLYSTDFAYLADVDARARLSGDLAVGVVEAAVKLGFTYDPAAGAAVASAAAEKGAATAARGSTAAAASVEPEPLARTAYAPADYAAAGLAQPGLPQGVERAAYCGDWVVRAELYGPIALGSLYGPMGATPGVPGSGPKIASAEATVGACYRLSRWEARLELPAAEVRKWSHEDPALYALVVSLVSPDGREVEHSACALGFRRVEVRDRSLLVNGERVLIKGVNRHEHDQRMGKTLELADMVRDIEIMKRHNFNAVRLSHYPNDERWYDLCDRYGLYLVDEANIESHAYYDQLCRDPRWAQAFLERGIRMVLRDKNHPSIIIWSLGNESGYGPNHDALAGWIRSFDPTRPLHYEGAVRPEWGGGAHDLESLKRGKAASDIVSTMYPPLTLLDEWSRTTEDERPFIMCEYSHAMGNSNGGLSDYWALIESAQGPAGRLHLGLGRPGDRGFRRGPPWRPRRPRRSEEEILEIRRRLRRRSQRPRFHLQRPRLPRPEREAGPRGVRQAVPVHRRELGAPALGPSDRPQQALFLLDRGCRHALGDTGRGRRAPVGRAFPAGDRARKGRRAGPCLPLDRRHPLARLPRRVLPQPRVLLERAGRVGASRP